MSGRALPPLPDPRRVRVTGGHLGITEGGSGGPGIVLLNGAGGTRLGWARIFGSLADLGRVVAISRFGTDGSSRPPGPQHGAAVVEVLRVAMRAIDMPGPVVIVGHSLGGLFANLHARRYRDEVAGVVFLDAAHPADQALAAMRPPWLRAVGRLLALVPGAPSGEDEVAQVSETCRQIDAAGPFPAILVAVVTGGRTPPSWLMPAAAATLRRSHQEALAALSPMSIHVIAARSGHLPQLSEPQVTVDAVAWVLARAEHGLLR